LTPPQTGLWADNFGHGEYGVSLTGGCRSAVAKMLGIDPVIRVITFGDGPAADAQRGR
jgi:ADP-ribose pyrophosphatase YjhB (NUDIX family)